MTETGCATSSKHERLNDAVDHLKIIRDQMENLLMKIDGSDQLPQTAKEPKPENMQVKSLVNTLDVTPAIIHEECDRMAELIARVKDMLF